MSSYLWQNFLHDSDAIEFIKIQIETFIQQHQTTLVLEIGPGKWAITREIKSLAPFFLVIEKDEKMLPHLHQLLSSSEIKHWDILDFDLQNLLVERKLDTKDLFIVGNLPYYITSPILRKFFAQGENTIQWGFFMVQKEVGEKIQTSAKKKSYLWRLLNRWYEVSYLKTIPASSFSPAPKVDSCLILLEKKKSEAVNFSQLLKFLDDVNPFSRKTLGKISKINNKKGEWNYHIPKLLEGKRLEECQRSDLELMLKKYAQ